MTEQEWSQCFSPDKMLDSFLLRKRGVPDLARFHPAHASTRKLRLFAVACFRRAWHLLPQEPSRRAVEVGEMLADGRADHAEVFSLVVATSADNSFESQLGGDALNPDAIVAAQGSCNDAVFAIARNQGKKDGHRVGSLATAARGERRAQADILRDIFGNPFRPPPPIDPSLLTPAIVALAGDIYQQRAFERLPELAAALEARGCRDAELLAHLRGPGPHVRGCWALDLVLGKQ